MRPGNDVHDGGRASAFSSRWTEGRGTKVQGRRRRKEIFFSKCSWKKSRRKETSKPNRWQRSIKWKKSSKNSNRMRNFGRNLVSVWTVSWHSKGDFSKDEMIVRFERFSTFAFIRWFFSDETVVLQTCLSRHDTVTATFSSSCLWSIVLFEDRWAIISSTHLTTRTNEFFVAKEEKNFRFLSSVEVICSIIKSSATAIRKRTIERCVPDVDRWKSIVTMGPTADRSSNTDSPSSNRVSSNRSFGWSNRTFS